MPCSVGPRRLTWSMMAAAVADYAPSATSDQKIHKTTDALDLKLVRTPDILSELGAARAGRDRPCLWVLQRRPATLSRVRAAS